MKKFISGLIILAMALSLTTALSATTSVRNENFVISRIQSLVEKKLARQVLISKSAQARHYMTFQGTHTS